ncbi:activating transcription factor 7-interacting protein 2 isoform X1 [Sciurus carolinensis]|uniref:activating transcription factor 7-interacting protein 2 isoform X1 n=3 Tax=Sciurus carolinensis TaxID=30640 RepID=UPI001FB40635|nr:activating transcription factor 7-interacting protein 2 isoform X1 [Sciurus carolinensis]XP_047388689.1 activating transcription factor 7-interacting protein 2 isoform X1 [Sciurus carolinensis]
MASPDRSKRKILKAKKTMPSSCRKQVEILNKSKNVEALRTAAIGSKVPSGSQNLSTELITSKCKHSENVDSSFNSNKNSVFSQKSIVVTKNLIKPVEEIVDSDTRLEYIDEQVVCRYQKPRKTLDSPSKLFIQRAEDSQNTSETHLEYQTKVKESFFEHEENCNLKPIYCTPIILSDIVQNTLNGKRIDEMVSNLEANSNSESLDGRQNDILNPNSHFVPVEKTSSLVNLVNSSCYTANSLKTEESCRTCHFSISNCESTDSKWQSLLNTDANNSHNQKKRMLSENKENVKRMKTSEPINENICVALEKQTAVLEQVRHLIRHEIYRINYKLFDKKLKELNERIGKTQCRNKHEATADELFAKIARLQRRIRTVLLSQRNCLEPNTLPNNIGCKIANSETMNLCRSQESVSDDRVTSMNCESSNTIKKTSEKMNLSPDCVEFVSESNNDDVMLISVESPNLTTPVTSNPTDIRKITSRNFNNSPNAIAEVRSVEKKKLDFVIDLTKEGLSNCNTGIPASIRESPLKTVLSSKDITPVAGNTTEDFDSFEHLPPLPEPPPLLPELVDKIGDTLPPQKPELKVKRVLKPMGIALTWNISKINPRCAPVESYHLFLCHENSTNKLIWKKIGEIKALPLPMACTLSQFLASDKYYFTIQSKDIFGRYGPFCDIKSIPGFSENLT